MRRNSIDDANLRLLIAFALSDDANCIDVGCAEGSVLAEMVRCAPRGRHVAYEPIPYWHAALVERFPQVDVRCAALSDNPGTADFVHVRSNPFFSGLRRRSYLREEELEEITVKVETLDQALPPGYVPALIKIDVEGAELQVLRGGRKTIVTHRPIVVFEHGLGGADHYGTRPGDVYDLLAGEAGLRIFDLDGAGPFSRAEFERLFATGDRINFVAHR
jgi:FkbM family methyltransferase